MDGQGYVVEEIEAAGFEAHVAEPAETQAMRGRKKRAKTEVTDARLLRDLLLAAGDLPESWIPLTPVLEWRERTRLYKSLIDQRLVWIQRIHAELYPHGVALPAEHIRSDTIRRTVCSASDDRPAPPRAPSAILPDGPGRPIRTHERRGGVR